MDEPSSSTGRDRGQILVMAALSMAVLLAIAALSIDASFMYDKLNRLHAAADAAALSAAMEVRRNPSVTHEQLVTFATDQVLAHGFNVVPIVNHPPGPDSAPYDNAKFVEVIVSEPTSTFFGTILGWTSMTPTASAVAGFSATANCLVTDQGTAIRNNALLTLTNCGVSVGELGVGDTASIVAPHVGVHGACVGCDGIANLHLNASPPSDPIGPLTAPSDPNPTLDCTSAPPTTFNMAQSIAAGKYCGWTFQDGSTVNLTLDPGIYYIAGPITSGAGGQITIAGTDVMIYLAPTGSINISSANVTYDLTGRTAAPYEGIVFYQDSLNTNKATLGQNGSVPVTINGALYFPGAELDLGSNSLGTSSDCLLIYATTLVMNGSGTFNNGCGSFSGLASSVTLAR
jgi:hypothetical protein